MLFDEFLVCGGASPALTCEGYELPMIGSCEYERSDLQSCLYNVAADAGTCGSTSPSCVTLCEAMAEPDCPDGTTAEACACWCEADLTATCHDLVDALVVCGSGSLTFGCDEIGVPILEGTACQSEWTALSDSCL
jgi:hypothetical protein